VEQLRSYQTIRKEASATVSAADTLKNTILWISIAGTEKKTNIPGLLCVYEIS
jgi:hypothetical protein